jgi:hypothetical protein
MPLQGKFADWQRLSPAHDPDLVPIPTPSQTRNEREQEFEINIVTDRAAVLLSPHAHYSTDCSYLVVDRRFSGMGLQLGLGLLSIWRNRIGPADRPDSRADGPNLNRAAGAKTPNPKELSTFSKGALEKRLCEFRLCGSLELGIWNSGFEPVSDS